MTIALKTAIFILAVAILLFSTAKKHARDQSDSHGEKPIVVMVKKTHGQLSYEVDSKPVKDPLWALAELVKLRGDNCPVIVILPWDATFREESDEQVIASKVGFKTIRSFVYNPDGGFMAEIKWGPSIPFTTNPPMD